MFKLFSFLVIGVCLAACSGEVESDSSDMATLEEAQTFGVGEFAPKNGSLIPVYPGDSTFYVVSTCTAKTAQGLANCYGALEGQCKAAGGVGLASKLKGAPNAEGRYNISGKCVVRGSAE